jgi:choline dehydrogenase-like flavoprotein
MATTRDLACDAVVVGTGLGGSTFAYGLARRGLTVVLVEAGDYLKPHSPDLSPLHPRRFEREPWVGGQTKIYGAAMYRLREIDFRATEMESGVSPEWPLSYADLEPYYAEAERLYRVHGSAEHDASEPPRSGPWPFAPIPHQGPVTELVERLKARSGVRVSHLPRAIDYNPGSGGTCVLCQHCDAYYCPRDAKMDAEIAALRPAVATGLATVLTGTQCLRVLTTPDGKRATGVRVRRQGEEFTIHARIVASSGGLTGTPLLLWRSRGGAHPNGLANASGALGRYFAAHTQGWVFPMSLGVQRTPFHQKTFAINTHYQSSPNWPYPTGVIQSAGYIEPLQMSRRYRSFVAAVLRNSFQTFYMTESLPSPDTGFALTDDGATMIAPGVQNPKTFARLRRLAIDLFKSAGYFVLAPPVYEKTWHAVGTARMGSDPRTSVVNADCQSHDVDGLYVVDSTVMPSAGAVNSGLTIAAIALRAAARVPVGA